jgi:homoserine kinase
VSRSVRVFAPATVGNVACGFDVLGLALAEPGDVVVIRPGAVPGVEITAITGDDGRLPRSAERNAAGLAARAVLRAAGVERTEGIRLELHKGLPLSSGLGGSAASSVAGAVAADAYLGTGLSREILLSCAGEGEAGGAGATHLDNAAPCLYGGICLVLPARDGLPDRVVELPVPGGLSVVVVHPHLEVRTADARKLLGDTVAMADAVAQWGNTAGLVAALYRGDLELLARTLVDRVAEPRRAALVPGLEAAKAAALAAGALGGSLSGSGPSVFALCPDLATAARAGEAMATVFRDRGTPCDIHASPVALQGARVLERED